VEEALLMCGNGVADSSSECDHCVQISARSCLNTPLWCALKAAYQHFRSHRLTAYWPSGKLEQYYTHL